MKTLFGVKDFQKTYDNHLKKMVKLQDDLNIKYDDIITDDSLESILCKIYSNKYYQYQTEAGGRWNKTSRYFIGEKRTLREKARVINECTRLEISENLTSHEIPVSYDTAFYISNYIKTNELMNYILAKV